MAFYPTSDADVLVAANSLDETCARIFAAAGMGEEDAALLARTLVASDLRGVHSHGTLRVGDYVGKLLDGGVDPRGRPRVASRKGGALVIDGGNAMGQVSSTFAMDAAIEAAREHGVAFAALGHSNHCGALDWYAQRASAQGMIGLCGTNALPTMAPVGGRDKIVGINPIGIALPGEDGDFVLDFAFGMTAHGKIRVYHQKNQPIPEGWALDAEGQPTTDAAKALMGLIQPIGGHKGVALGMAVGMLSTLLSGAGYGRESGNMVDGARAGRDGQFFLAVDVAAFTDLTGFRARVAGIAAEVRGSDRRAGIDRLYVPGDIERLLDERHRAGGIPLPCETIAEITAACKRLGLPPPDLSNGKPLT